MQPPPGSAASPEKPRCSRRRADCRPMSALPLVKVVTAQFLLGLAAAREPVGACVGTPSGVWARSPPSGAGATGIGHASPAGCALAVCARDCAMVASHWATCSSKHAICANWLVSTKRCCSRICPTSAASSCARFAGSFPRATLAKTCGSGSPASSAVSSARAERPRMLVATALNLWLVSSRTFWSRLTTRARSAKNVVRERVRSRSWRWGRGGRNCGAPVHAEAAQRATRPP